jgi:ATP-dependent helicase/nuclease subunit A
MSEDLKDKKARDRIKELTGTGMAVEAAAGTGKTTAMVSRIMSLIKSGAPMREIAAITFTEKAAAELELRVREELEKALDKDDDLEPKKREKLGQALSELDRSQISTIHAFAMTMIKERPVEAGVDPESEIMDSVRDALWFPESWQSWLSRQDSESYDTLARAVRLGVSLQKMETLAKKLAGERDVARILKNYLQSVKTTSPELLAEDIRSLAPEAEKLFKDCDKWCADTSDKAYQCAREWSETACSLTDKDPWRRLEIFAEIPAGVIKTGVGKQDNYESKEKAAKVKTRLKNQKDAIKEIQSQIKTLVVNQALLMLCGFVEGDWQRRRRAGLLNFQDLLILAGELLGEEDAREYYRKRWKYLLVDEFQDTDPLQVKIIDRLFDDNERLKGLFLVGDPKQSIYRFRRADISIYRKKVGEFCEKLSQRPETLNTNFRSVPGIIGWVNREFEKIIEEQGDYQARYLEMEPHREAGDILPPPVSVLHPADDGFLEMKADERRALEANHIAALIERLVRSGEYFVREKGKEGDGLSPLNYRHVAVLFFTRPTNAEEWLEPFLKRGIPFVTDLGRSFFKRDEAAAVQAALQAVEDPSDSLSLFAALRSPLMGFSDEELLSYKRKLDYRETLDYRREDVEDFPDINRALGFFRKLHKERNQKPIAQTVEELLKDTGLRVSALISREDDTGVMDLERFAGLARAYQDMPGADFPGFVSHLSELAALDTESREPVTLDPGEEFVRFSTVHSAKGLEFPVVIIANLTSNAKRPAGTILVDRLEEKRAAVLAGGKYSGLQSSGYEEMAGEEEKHQFEESKRLLYVAATRARDALIFSVFPPCLPDKPPDGRKKSTSYIDLLPGYMKTWHPGRETDPDGKVVFWDSSKLDLDYEGLGKTEKGEKKTGQRPADLKKFKEDRKKLIENAGRGIEVRTATRGEREEPEEVYDDQGAAKTIKSAGRGEGILIGSVVHAVMEDVDIMAGKADQGLVKARAKSAGLEGRREEIAELVNNCLESGPVKRAAASGSFHKEAPYSVWIEDALHEGRIDLLFREGDTIVVVDYKTDHVSPKAIPDKLDGYRGQGDEYRKAVRKATGAEDVEVWFVFARPGVALELK